MTERRFCSGATKLSQLDLPIRSAAASLIDDQQFIMAPAQSGSGVGMPRRNQTPKHKRHPLRDALYVGAPGRIRTSGPLIRSQVLYPAELRAR